MIQNTPWIHPTSYHISFEGLQFSLSAKNYMVFPHHYQIFVQIWGQTWGTLIDLASSSSRPTRCSGPSTGDGSKGSSAAGNSSPEAHNKQNQRYKCRKENLLDKSGQVYMGNLTKLKTMHESGLNSQKKNIFVLCFLSIFAIFHCENMHARILWDIAQFQRFVGSMTDTLRLVDCGVYISCTSSHTLAVKVNNSIDYMVGGHATDLVFPDVQHSIGMCRH